MMLVSLLAAAFVAHQTAQPPQDAAPSALAQQFSHILASEESRPNTAELYRQARGPKDADWSAATEQRLQRHFTQSPAVAAELEQFSATCSDTICEVLASARARPESGVSDVVMELQSLSLRLDADLNLRPISHGIGSTPEGTGLFYAYWRRD